LFPVRKLPSKSAIIRKKKRRVAFLEGKKEASTKGSSRSLEERRRDYCHISPLKKRELTFGEGERKR